METRLVDLKAVVDVEDESRGYTRTISVIEYGGDYCGHDPDVLCGVGGVAIASEWEDALERIVRVVSAGADADEVHDHLVAEYGDELWEVTPALLAAAAEEFAAAKRENTTIRTLRYGKGYRGRNSTKPYIAEIVGSDTRYGLRREFLEPVSVEREHYNRARTMVDVSYELVPDTLYEVSEAGDRWHVVCYLNANGEVKVCRASDARLKAWVTALDGGATGREARLATKGL